MADRPRYDIVRLSRPHLATLWIVVVFAVIANLYLRQVLQLTPEETFYRQIVIIVALVLLVFVALFVHVILFRKTSIWRDAFRQHASSGLRGEFLQEVWVEINNYPVRYCFYAYVVNVYTVALVTALAIMIPFVVHSVSGLTYLMHVVISVSLLVWPLVTVQYYVLEENQRRVAAVFLQDVGGRIRWSDPRIIPVSIRTKLMISFLTAVVFTAMFVGMTLYQVFLRGEPGIFRQTLSGVLVCVVLYGTALAYLTGRSISRSIRGMEDLLGRGTAVDANGRRAVPTAGTTDELGRFTAELAAFQARFGEFTARFHDRLADQFQRLEAMTTVANKQAADSARYAEEAANQAGRMEEWNHSFQQIHLDTEGVYQNVQKGMGRLEEGREKLHRTLVSVEQIRHEAVQNAQRVMDLSLRMMQIEEVVKIITYVTDQTKILAFNASIETASAGEMGERFGVVAKEIRQLAENIAQSTEQIRTIIDEVRKASHVSVLAAEKELKQIDLGLESGREAQDSFYEIVDVVRETADVLAGITQGLTQLKVVHEQMGGTLRALEGGVHEGLGRNRSLQQDAQALVVLSRDLMEAVDRLEGRGTDRTVRPA
jgi:methyl-accepting chemotaxis protein